MLPGWYLTSHLPFPGVIGVPSLMCALISHQGEILLSPSTPLRTKEIDAGYRVRQLTSVGLASPLEANRYDCTR